MSSIWRVGLCGGVAFPGALALVLAVAGCGGGQEPAGADQQARESVEASAEELPERDVSGIEVCEMVPAEALAEATGMPVAEAPWRLDNDPAPNCTYRLRGASGSGERIDIYLQDPFDFDWARRTAEDFDREILEVDDLGVAAYMKESPDGWWEVWARRRDGVVVQTTAREQQPALTSARVAIERIP